MKAFHALLVPRTGRKWLRSGWKRSSRPAVISRFNARRSIVTPIEAAVINRSKHRQNGHCKRFAPGKTLFCQRYANNGPEKGEQVSAISAFSQALARTSALSRADRWLMNVSCRKALRLVFD